VPCISCKGYLTLIRPPGIIFSAQNLGINPPEFMRHSRLHSITPPSISCNCSIATYRALTPLSSISSNSCSSSRSMGSITTILFWMSAADSQGRCNPNLPSPSVRVLEQPRCLEHRVDPKGHWGWVGDRHSPNRLLLRQVLYPRCSGDVGNKTIKGQKLLHYFGCYKSDRLSYTSSDSTPYSDQPSTRAQRTTGRLLLRVGRLHSAIALYARSYRHQQ